MGRIARVLSATRRTIRQIPVLVVGVLRGGNWSSDVDHFGPAGDDSPPLPGDYAITLEGEGREPGQAIGYHDPEHAGQALPGERRLYVREEDGAIVGTIWLKRGGVIRIEADTTVEVSAPEVKLGDGAQSIATAGDLVSMYIPAPINAPLVGRILPRQTKAKA